MYLHTKAAIYKRYMQVQFYVYKLSYFDFNFIGTNAQKPN